MAVEGSEVRGIPTLEEARSVNSKQRPRKVHNLGTSYTVTIPMDWCQDLGLDEQGEPLTPMLVTGAEEVVISEPAIVYLPSGGDSNNEFYG